MKKIMTVAASLIVVIPLLLTGCSGHTITEEQKGWVASLQANYPDDEFVCKGQWQREAFATDPDTVCMTSKLFKGHEFKLYMNGDQLYSDYPCMYHEKAIEDYYGGIISPCFDCNELVIMYSDHESKPIAYLSHEEYIEKYAVPVFSVILYYKDDHEYPGEDEIVSAILNSLVPLEDQNAKIHFYFCRPNIEEPTRNRDAEYYIHYHEGTIIYFCNYGENRKIFTDEMTLEEALSLYRE